MAWYLTIAVLLLLCFVFNAGLTVGKRYPYVPAFASPQPPMEQNTGIEDIARQIVLCAKTLFPKIKNFEVDVQYRYIFNPPASPFYEPFPAGVWAACLAHRTKDGRHVPLWETYHTRAGGTAIPEAMCAMLEELKKEVKT